jgi:hypothetical protein
MDNDPNNNPSPTVPDGAQLTPAVGGENVVDTLSLAELNQHLGTNYKDKPTALAALKETKSYVGKKIDAANPAPVADPALAAQVQSLEEQVFFATNPQYKGHETVIAAMRNGKPLSEVVQSEAFKTYFGKAEVADKVAQTKSVVASNSRLGADKSITDEARTIANAQGSSTSDVAGVFAKAIAENLS